MNKYIGIIAGLTAASMAASAAGQARDKTVPCLKRSTAIKHLGKKYSEIPVATGLTNNGAVLEVLSSKTGKNWTIMVTLPNGTACMIAAGENWEKVPYSISKILGPKA
jgi:hypothetical protein